MTAVQQTQAMGEVLPADFAIVGLSEVSDPFRVNAEMDEIFFTSSNRQTFSSNAERMAFRQRWLGRYMNDRTHGFVALSPQRATLGYVVGALDDPTKSARYEDISYFRDFTSVTPRFPAHLHINVAAHSRALGIGSRLLTAFVDHARVSGAPGVHVVTSRGSRNVGFYERNGFFERASTVSEGRELVLLGRELAG